MKALFWSPRGIGLNGGWASLVTGQHVDFGPDVSGFVNTREEGEAVVEMFGGNAKLDFRPSEPNWIQVKVLVEEKDKAVLERLVEGVRMLDGFLNPHVLKWAIDPENHPGYEPTGIRAMRELRERMETHEGG